MRGYRPPYDENKYVQYYLNQAGSGLPGYEGSSTQYGAGIGGMFRSLFRMAIPLFRRGVSIAKPHLKTAAKHIIGDVMTNIAHAASTPKQQGAGMRVYARRATKYPPIGCGRTRAPARRRKQNKRLASIKKRAKPKRIRKVSTRRFRGAANDIFI